MSFPVDADLAVFLFTLGHIGLGSLPQLRKSVSRVPMKYQMEEVSPAALTPAQAAVFAPYDEKLAAMNCFCRACRLLAGPGQEAPPGGPGAAAGALSKFCSSKVLTTKDTKVH